MSRRHTSSGSRFQPLHVEGEDEEEEEDDVFASSTEEMNLSLPGNYTMRSSGSASPVGGMTSSRRLYQTGTPISHTGSHQRESFRSMHSNSSESPAGEMQLSRNFDPAAFPLQSSQTDDPGRYGPQTIGAGSSGSQNLWKNKPAQIRSRSVSSKPSVPEEQSGLDFVWDHYRRDSNPFDDVGEDALGDVFGQNTADSEEEEISMNIENDVLILRSIGFNIDYPKGKLGEGFYGVVYRGHYGSDVSFSIEICSKIF